MRLLNSLLDHLRAGVGGVRVLTHDEPALFDQIDTFNAGRPDLDKVRLVTWDSGVGYQRRNQLSLVEALKDVRGATGKDSPDVLFVVSGCDEFFAEDVSSRRVVIEARRRIEREDQRILIVLLTHEGDVHDEVDTEWPLVKHLLPDAVELGEALHRQLEASMPALDCRAAGEALAGLTVTAALNLLAVEAVRLSAVPEPVDLLAAKARHLGSEAFLAVQEPRGGFETIVGHDDLKTWLRQRRGALLGQSVLQPPRGILLAGPPGTGKTRLPAALAVEWGVSLLLLDVNALFNKYLGESESRIAKALQMAEAMAPCVLLIDEVERAFSEGKGGDDGTAGRITGKILSWTSEKTAPVFVVFTANWPQYLPAAMLRTGRLDARWVADLPDEDERFAVWKHYNDKVPTKIGSSLTDEELKALAALTVDFSQAEIEGCVTEGLFEAEIHNRPLGEADLTAAVACTQPIARAFANDITLMRTWARQNARPTSASKDEPLALRGAG